MWRLLSIAAWLALICPALAGAEDDLPVAAVVAVAEAEIYSGPVGPRYVTQTLARGTPVEVYDRQGDWLAIRPPEGSFSWVAAASMIMTAEPGVAEAAADSVPSWIGTSAQRVRQHGTTVCLKRGERVEVLGKKEVENDDGQREVWLKIAPPSGEFRWIHASQVSRQSPPFEPQAEEKGGALAPRMPASASDLPVFQAEPSRDQREASRTGRASAPRSGAFRRSSMELRDIEPPAPVVRQAAFEQDAASGRHRELTASSGGTSASLQILSPDGFVPRRPRPADSRPASAPRRLPPSTAERLPAAALSASVDARGQEFAPAELPAAETGRGGIPSAEVQRRLEEIDVALALMVSRDRSQWNLAALKRETERLIEEGATPIDRGQARFLLDKIERFAEAFGVEEEDGTLELPVGSLAARKAALAAATAPKYDGVGYLTPVRAARPVAPYALLDEDGKPLAYVTPQPGFNLKAYENRKIGIFGRRGYVPIAGAPHLLAERVVDLDKQVR
jgi:hypothetical protein